MLSSAIAPAGAIRPLCWRSPQQLQRLTAGLQASLDDWARQWGVTAAQARLDNAWEDEAPAAGPWPPIAAGTQGEVVAWWSHQAAVPLALERLLFGAPPAAGSSGSHGPGLSAALAGDALAALRRTLAQWLGAEEAAVGASQVPPDHDWRPWSGAVLAELAFGPAQERLLLRLHVGAAAWPRQPSQAPAAKPMSPALASLPDALARQPLKLQARLADVQVTLGELMGLGEGDVLVTGHRLADPLSVSLPQRDAPTLYGGRLVQREGRMAVALTRAG